MGLYVYSPNSMSSLSTWINMACDAYEFEHKTIYKITYNLIIRQNCNGEDEVILNYFYYETHFISKSHSDRYK